MSQQEAQKLAWGLTGELPLGLPGGRTFNTCKNRKKKNSKKKKIKNFFFQIHPNLEL
jgi:hypothetical protein